MIKPLVPTAKPGGRPEDDPKREILNGLFSLLRRGWAWRMLPQDLPPWRLVYDSLWTWRQDGIWPLIHDLLRGDGRAATGKRRQSSAAISDSQASKPRKKGLCGDDAGKQGKGRQRPLLVETLGFVFAVVITAAKGHDRDGAKRRLAAFRPRLSRVRHIWAEGAYSGPQVDGVKALRPQRPLRLAIPKRSEAAQGCEVIPKRGLVARAFGWFHRDRRLRQDDEHLPQTSAAAMSHGVLIQLMIRRFAPTSPS